MKDILTGIGAALLIALCIVFVLGCSAFEKTENDYILEMVEQKHHLIWPNILMANCKLGRISHSAHLNWIRMMSKEGPAIADSQGMINHEFRQNIADLQNRVYELEND